MTETPAPETTVIELRPCTPDDVAQIAAIYRDAVLHGTASFEIEPPDDGEMAARRAALVEVGYPYIVAVQDGGVVGYAYAGPYRPRPAYSSTVENSVYVRPDRHGHGIGRALLDRLVVEAAARGYRQMVAVIGDSANRASVELHRRAGFALVGTLRDVGWKHGRWLDTVLMQRALGSGSVTQR